MKNIYILLVICFSYINNISSQSNFEFEISEGFVFLDYFGNEPEPYDNVFAGYGVQSEIDIWRKIYSNNHIEFKVGFGYTGFLYLYDYGFTFVAQDIPFTSYVNLKFGMNYKPNWSRVYFIMNMTNYFLPYKEKQDNSQNRYFGNLDLGLKFNIIKTFNIAIWSPLTFYPMFNGRFVSKPLNINFDPWIEITGLNLGISYGFGKKK